MVGMTKALGAGGKMSKVGGRIWPIVNGSNLQMACGLSAVLFDSALVMQVHLPCQPCLSEAQMIASCSALRSRTLRSPPPPFAEHFLASPIFFETSFFRQRKGVRGEGGGTCHGG